MSKLFHLIRRPMDLFKGATENPQRRSGPIYVIGFSTWKQYMRKYFSDRKLVFLPKDISESQFEQEWKSKIARSRDSEIFVWGYKAPEYILQLSKEKNSPVRFVEDGFVRSIELGATKAPPMSLCIDGKTPYFDMRQVSELEELIQNYDFSADPMLLERAKKALDRFIAAGISKYNHIPPVDIEDIYGPKSLNTRVLVLGQVEDDASIVYGASRKLTNRDVIDLAVKENPDAQIIFKIHPDVTAGYRGGSAGRNMSGVYVVSTDIPLHQAFHDVDIVYTISSLGGFEAALRGIKVVTLGAPFYSGWGFTDDRDPVHRRTAKRQPIEVFALAYLKYAHYYNPETGEKIEPEAVFERIEAEMEATGRSPSAMATSKAMTPTPTPKPKPKPKAQVDEPKPKSKLQPESQPKLKPVETVKATASEAQATSDKKTKLVPADSAKSKPQQVVESKNMPTQTKSVAVKPKEPTPTKVAAKPAVTVAASPTPIEVVTIPTWYIGESKQDDFVEGRPTFVYLSWIAEHGDALVGKLKRQNSGVDFRSLDMIEGISHVTRRREALRFARENPDLMRRMVIRRLVPIRDKITGFIFTLDWVAIMRIVAEVCEELEIPRILIPHEAVFVDREKYYWDPVTNASVPVCDIVLGWGGMQRDIFLERGYPAERFFSVGAPKFDAYHDYKPRLTRAQYCRLFNLDPNKKIIFFASQPLDSQLDMKVARESQRQAIRDLLAYCDKKNCQLIVRLPPSKDNILGPGLTQKVVDSNIGAIDDAVCYLVPPEEAIYHADVVTSVNSTMLFEGVLAGRPALSLKYVSFEQIWEKAGIPAVSSGAELPPILDRMLAGEWKISQDAFNWAAAQFGVGRFDGMAGVRITDYLRRIAVEGIGSFGGIYRSGFEKIKRGDRLDVVAIPSGPSTLSGVQKHLGAMLNCNRVLTTLAENVGVKELSAAELFLQWGLTHREHKKRAAEMAKKLSRDVIFVEDGFLRSVGIGLSGEPALSIVLDTKTAYYDVSKASLMESILSSDWELSPTDRKRAVEVIKLIQEGRVSKYNHAPEIKLDIADDGRGRPKVLVLDQRFGDQSVASGGANATDFERMLLDAINDNPDSDILVKLHPDAITGGKQSYFASRPGYADHLSRLHYISYDINPHSLFDIVQKVYVVTSGMGFEALMAGKEVHVYGGAYYAGWGVTIDHFQRVERRKKQRSVEEIFYVAYIMLSRYYDMASGKQGQIESVIRYIIEKKKELKLPHVNA